MQIRGVEIEVLRAATDEADAELIVPEQASARPSGEWPDERMVRAGCARGIIEAQVRGAASVALPAFGISDGMSPVMAAKIMVQEAIRVARSGTCRVTRIVLCCKDDRAYDVFARTVNGYLRHFLDVLIWGPFVTVDAIIEVSAGIVLVKRSNPPLGYALPGGFVDYGESLEDAVCREAREETGLALLDLRQFHTYSDPGRDPRFQTVSTVFSARAHGVPRAGDDAADVLVASPEEIAALPFAFDHGRILEDWRAKRT